MNRNELIRKIRLKLEVEKREATNDYYSYVRHTNPDFDAVKHQKFICDIIDRAIKKKEAMRRGEIPKENQYIMLNLPPRHGKSATVTETLPSYYMGKFPNDSVIVTGYSDTFAANFGRKNKLKIEQYGKDMFDIELSKYSSASNNFALEGYRGEMICSGILGQITGKGADLCIIDDPIPNRESANSPTMRNKIWAEWNDTLHSRQHPMAIYILIMTRWHEDDLSGRLMNEEFGEPYDWQIVNLPLIAEEDDILGREIGEVLWEGRLSDITIQRLRGVPQTFNSLYQGRPSSQEGNMFKRCNWGFYKYRREFIDSLPVLFMSIDGALTDTNDRVSIQVWGKKNANFYGVDNVTDRLDFTMTLQTIRMLLAKHPRISAKYVENRASGSPIMNVLNKEIGGFLKIEASSATGGKEQRALAISPYQESGNILLPEGEPWVNDFIEELAAFPNGRYKDQVDAFTQIINKMLGIDATKSVEPYDMMKEFYGRSHEKDYDVFEGFDDSFNDFGCGGI